MTAALSAATIATLATADGATIAIATATATATATSKAAAFAATAGCLW